MLRKFFKCFKAAVPTTSFPGRIQTQDLSRHANATSFIKTRTGVCSEVEQRFVDKNETEN
jgi:hypothetical protein